MVVAQVLRLVGRVHGAEKLLCSEFIHGVSGLFGYPLVQCRFFGFGSRGTGNQTVAPVDGVDVVHTQYGWCQFHPPFYIARLGDEVVHDTRCRTVLLCERGTA